MTGGTDKNLGDDSKRKRSEDLSFRNMKKLARAKHEQGNMPGPGAVHENESLRTCFVSRRVHNEETRRVTTKVDTPDRILAMEIDGASSGRTLTDMEGNGAGKAESVSQVDGKGQHYAEIKDRQNELMGRGMSESLEKAARFYGTEALERDTEMHDPQQNSPTEDDQDRIQDSTDSSSSTGTAGSAKSPAHSSSPTENYLSESISEYYWSDLFETSNDSSSSESSGSDHASKLNVDGTYKTVTDGFEAISDISTSESTGSDGSEANGDT